MHKGYIKIYRKILEWEWYSDINTTRLFLHLILTANFEDKKWHGIDIARGQIITSLANLAKSTSLSVQQIRTSLAKLKSTQEVTIKATKLHTFITLTNYRAYQDKLVATNTQDNTDSNFSSTHEQQSINTRATTTKELKNVKNIIKKVAKNPKDFIAPTLQEVEEYCTERSNSVKPNKFLDHYESNGWKVGKNPMKNWKAAVRKWESDDSSTNSPKDSLANKLNTIAGGNYFQSVTMGDTIKITCVAGMKTNAYSLPAETKAKIKAEFTQPIQII